MAIISVTLKQMNETATRGEIRDHEVVIDRPRAKNGNDAGPMGGELLLAALGGCFSSNLLAAIRARDLAIHDVVIEVRGNLVDHPQRYDSIEMIVHSDHPDRDEFEKLVTIAERGCIVANSLRNGLELIIRID